MKDLSFWAQSLDNQSPDFIYRDGQELDDPKLRQQLVSEIYNVPGEKKRLSDHSDVAVRCGKTEFIIEAIPSEKDDGNRLAPIVIFGKFPDKPSKDWVGNVRIQIEDVVTHKIKRTLHQATLQTISSWLLDVLEKREEKVIMKIKVIGLVMAFLIPLIIGGLLEYRQEELATIQIAGLIALNNVMVMYLQMIVVDKSRKKFSVK